MKFEKYTPRKLRQTILKMAYKGNANHIACSFSIVEIVAVLFESYLGNDEKIFLSKGHGVMAMYACLVEKGVLPQSLIENYFSDGSAFAGLSESHVPGLEVSSGSLGHGLSVAVGAAYYRKKKQNNAPLFCIVGDGEMNEGSMWEALLFSAHHKLKNLCILIDENRWQAMGRTADILSLGSLENKFTAFDFEVLSVDGHDPDQIDSALKTLIHSNSEKPKALICKTTKGAGVSFMADNNQWHYTRLTPEIYEKAMKELEG